MKKSIICLLLFSLTPFLIITAQPVPVMNSSELHLALKKLNILGSVLYLAAHPDDENTAVLSYFSSGELVRTGYLSITRGDGGQNLIGNEKDELLGVLRTHELLQARKVDGAEQFFTRAIDFGFSKSAEETFNLWGKNAILGDVVWIIRNFKPDVIITRFPVDGRGGHGQHVASALLALEAFDLSDDSSAYPEQLRFVKPWKVKRIFWNRWIGPGEDPSGLIKINTGAYNSLLGKSFSEIAALSRTMHKSQGFGSSARRGEGFNYFELMKGDTAEHHIFDNIDISWNRVKGSEKLIDLLKKAEQDFDPGKPSDIIPLLLQAYKEMGKLKEDHWIPIKKKELLEVIRSAAGIWLEATVQDYSASPGDSLFIDAGAVNRSDINFQLKKIEIKETALNHSFDKALVNGVFFNERINLKLPLNLKYTGPYWLANDPLTGIYSVNDLKMTGKSLDDPPVNVIFTLAADDIDLPFTIPVFYRWTDPVNGEQYRPLEIIPRITLEFESSVYLFPSNNPKDLLVMVKNHSRTFSGKLKLNAPSGWDVKPEEIPLSFHVQGEEHAFRFKITPPSGDAEGFISAEVSAGEEKFSAGMITIDHPHIPAEILFPHSEAKLLRVNLPGIVNSIGYIEGSGDEIAECLLGLGYSLTNLSENNLENDLSMFDVIITGIRAFNTKDFLQRRKGKLFEYVEKGGTLLVQYNTNNESAKEVGPYPFNISRERVAEEDAPVTILKPNHPLMNFPNKITESDFEGWIQERGLYFADSWSAEYETIISSQDTGEEPKEGGLLLARYGKGTFIYTGYSWFRQLPAGVKGAYRIFVNLISAGKQNG